ncbi:hypothetical protein GCM10022222_25490 [Amycolatopsis ultiminotia]|uniref:Uncharacterized protein n=1 Tax=Amycolatopsis ultiminotia TaxID=543629 RepID=A0ABP6VTR4_9PSEU
MRNPFGAVAIGAAVLLAAACSASPTAAPAPPSAPEPLTAAAALGDFASIDYCSLLDPARLPDATAAAPDSSFTDCRVDLVQAGHQVAVTVGPLAADRDPNVRPYNYPGRVPDGVAVQQSGFAPDQACVRVITFADGIRLPVSVTGGEPEARCTGADAVVGGALAALGGGRARHVQFPDRSWGRVDSCALLETHDLDAASGAGTKASPGLAGHSCIRGKVSVDFAVVKQAPTGPSETLGGRTARITTDGAFCRARVVQPSPATAGRAEQATVSVVDTTGEGGDAACATVRTAAAPVFAKIP